jgi:hypothetical protein
MCCHHTICAIIFLFMSTALIYATYVAVRCKRLLSVIARAEGLSARHDVVERHFKLRLFARTPSYRSLARRRSLLLGWFRLATPFRG